MGSPHSIHDIDITTGDKSIDNLAIEVNKSLSTKFKTILKTMHDGHHSVVLSNIKIDFSSNFISPTVANLPHASISKEMISRDYTCNALLCDLNLSNIKDPTNRGKKDIDNKILNTCLTPEITLSDDPKRIPRILYLSSKLDFNIDKSIINFLSNNKDLIYKVEKEYTIKKLAKAYSYNRSSTIRNIKLLGLEDYIRSLGTIGEDHE